MDWQLHSSVERPEPVQASGCSFGAWEWSVQSEAVQVGNLNTDFKRSEEERCRQSFAKEGQISVIAYKAQGRREFRGTHHRRPHRDGPAATPGE